MVAPDVVAKNLMTTLDLGQSRVVLGGWKIFDNDIGATFVGASVAAWLLMDGAYGSKNALLEFMDLSGTNYKFMDQKMHH